jgi:hypothetical protein
MYGAAPRYFLPGSGEPLYTINGQHLVSRFELCGGANIFCDAMLAPQVSHEAVIAAIRRSCSHLHHRADPLPVAGVAAHEAVRGRLFTLPADEISCDATNPDALG